MHNVNFILPIRIWPRPLGVTPWISNPEQPNSVCLQKVAYNSFCNLCCSKGLFPKFCIQIQMHVNLVYILYIWYEQFLFHRELFLLLAGNLKTYRDGSSQCILVSPDKSMLTVKFTLKWNKDINLYKSNTHNCSSMCQYSTFKNIYLMLQKSLNFPNILDY